MTRAVNCFVIDMKGRQNLRAYEIPSAVGMRGLFVPELKGEFDFIGSRFEAMQRAGQLRPATTLLEGQ